ncbi:MAG TPA: hypothetical protein VFS33_11565 [Gemmatimonadales bacterium]|nr:hypothetical protein [Gemmatimonadales bacterium]
MPRRVSVLHELLISAGLLLATVTAPAHALWAQAAEFTIPPSNVVPNYNRVSLGQREALEAGAYVARTDDALANWYNPAGLSLSEKTALNASSNAFQVTSAKLNGVGPQVSSTRFSPVNGFFGFVVGTPIVKSPRWRFGFGYTRPVAWSPGTIRGGFDMPVGGGIEAFSYSSAVSFSTTIPSLNTGYRLSPTVRLGLGIGVGITDLTQNQTLTDRLVMPTSVATGIRVISTDGSVYHLLLSAGAQWDLAPNVTLGGLLSLPGIRMGGSSEITLSQTVFQAGGASDDLAFADPSAKFDYRIPFRAVVGATYRYARGQVELDVRYFAGHAAYPLFSSDSTALHITTIGAGIPAVTAPALAPVLVQTRSIVAAAIGGNYSLFRSLGVHAGFFVDPSPVSAPAQSIVRAVDLIGFSGGVSFGAGRLTASLGASASWGTTSERQIGPSLGGLQTVTEVYVQTVTGLYAISFEF